MPVATAQLTPVELHGGLLLKREDQHRHPSGVNGSKLRACQYLLGRARERGATRVISAASVLSPQNAMAAVVARDLGMSCTVILGGTKPETALRHRSPAIAAAAGADFEYIKVGYNPALQRAARQLAAADRYYYHLSYGVTYPPDATTWEIRDFYAVGAAQVANLPDSVRTLVIPFGSGNTACGVLLGLAEHAPAALERIITIGIGPDRRQWLDDRLGELDAYPPFPMEHVQLHPDFATYGDKMKASIGNVRLHETYEAKIAVWAEQNRPGWWTRRDGSTCLWVVGGPI